MFSPEPEPALGGKQSLHNRYSMPAFAQKKLTKNHDKPVRTAEGLPRFEPGTSEMQVLSGTATGNQTASAI